MTMKVKGSPKVRNSVLRVSGEKADFQIADEMFVILHYVLIISSIA